MPQFWRRTRARWCALVCILVSASAFSDWSIHDPWDLNQRAAPEPGTQWVPAQPLPVVPAPQNAVSGPGAQPLTLPELTELALRNNPKTRQAWFAARAAAANVGIEQADLLPQANAGYAGSRTLPVSATTGTQSPWLNRWGPSISLSYILFDFGARSDQVESAGYRLLAANLAQNRVLQEVVLLVEQAYYQLVGVEALVRVNEQSLKNNQTALDAAQRRRESGLATVADVYRAETQVAQSQLNLTRSRGDLQKVRGQLASAVGLPVNGAMKVQTLSGPPQIREVVASLNDLLEQAKKARPDLIAAEAQARAARATASATSKAGLPSIEITGAAGYSVFGGNQPGVNNYSLAFNLRVPLFSGFRDTYSVRQAEAQASQAEAARDSLYQQTQLDVWLAYYDLQTAASGTASTEAQVRSAEQTAQATLARYQGGFGSILDLITAQQDESNARVQRIQSYLDWFTALARLTYAMGQSDVIPMKDVTR